MPESCVLEQMVIGDKQANCVAVVPGVLTD